MASIRVFPRNQASETNISSTFKFDYALYEPSLASKKTWPGRTHDPCLKSVLAALVAAWYCFFLLV